MEQLLGLIFAWLIIKGFINQAAEDGYRRGLFDRLGPEPRDTTGDEEEHWNTFDPTHQTSEETRKETADAVKAIASMASQKVTTPD